NDFVVLDDWSTAISWVNGGIRLHREQTTVADVGKILDLNARDNAAGIGDLPATCRITVGHHRRAHLGQRPDFQRFQSVEKLFVFDFQKRQIAVMSYEADFGQVWAGILITVNEHLFGPAHDVGIGHNALTANDEARTRSLPDHV